jgi:hypothetical protein
MPASGHPQQFEKDRHSMVKPREIAHERRLNGRQRLVVIIMDVLLLAELTVSMYIGHRDPEYMAAIFMKTFVPMAVATVIAARVLMRKLRTEELAPALESKCEVSDP